MPSMKHSDRDLATSILCSTFRPLNYNSAMTWPVVSSMLPFADRKGFEFGSVLVQFSVLILLQCVHLLLNVHHLYPQEHQLIRHIRHIGSPAHLYLQNDQKAHVSVNLNVNRNVMTHSGS